MLLKLPSLWFSCWRFAYEAKIFIARLSEEFIVKLTLKAFFGGLKTATFWLSRMQSIPANDWKCANQLFNLPRIECNSGKHVCLPSKTANLRLMSKSNWNYCQRSHINRSFYCSIRSRNFFPMETRAWNSFSVIHISLGTVSDPKQHRVVNNSSRLNATPVGFSGRVG